MEERGAMARVCIPVCANAMARFGCILPGRLRRCEGERKGEVFIEATVGEGREGERTEEYMEMEGGVAGDVAGAVPRYRSGLAAAGTSPSSRRCRRGGFDRDGSRPLASLPLVFCVG